LDGREYLCMIAGHGVLIRGRYSRRTEEEKWQAHTLLARITVQPLGDRRQYLLGGLGRPVAGTPTASVRLRYSRAETAMLSLDIYWTSMGHLVCAWRIVDSRSRTEALRKPGRQRLSRINIYGALWCYISSSSLTVVASMSHKQGGRR
jgi:hypothetical protein